MKPKRAKPRIIKLAATFGVHVIEMDTSILPQNIVGDYGATCNWLSERLEKSLLAAGIDFEVLEDERDGEGIAVRIAFDWDPRSKELDFGDISPWELLELLPYSELYPDQ